MMLKFKYANFDMKRFVESCRERADVKRREAEILLAQANAMDEMTRHFEAHIIEVENDPS